MDTRIVITLDAANVAKLDGIARKLGLMKANSGSPNRSAAATRLLVEAMGKAAKRPGKVKHGNGN